MPLARTHHRGRCLSIAAMTELTLDGSSFFYKNSKQTSFRFANPDDVSHLRDTWTGYAMALPKGRYDIQSEQGREELCLDAVAAFERMPQDLLARMASDEVDKQGKVIALHALMAHHPALVRQALDLIPAQKLASLISHTMTAVLPSSINLPALGWDQVVQHADASDPALLLALADSMFDRGLAMASLRTGKRDLYLLAIKGITNSDTHAHVMDVLMAEEATDLAPRAMTWTPWGAFVTSVAFAAGNYFKGIVTVPPQLDRLTTVCSSAQAASLLDTFRMTSEQGLWDLPWLKELETRVMQRNHLKARASAGVMMQAP